MRLGRNDFPPLHVDRFQLFDIRCKAFKQDDEMPLAIRHRALGCLYEKKCLHDMIFCLHHLIKKNAIFPDSHPFPKRYNKPCGGMSKYILLAHVSSLCSSQPSSHQPMRSRSSRASRPPSPHTPPDLRSYTLSNQTSSQTPRMPLPSSCPAPGVWLGPRQPPRHLPARK